MMGIWLKKLYCRIEKLQRMKSFFIALVFVCTVTNAFAQESINYQKPPAPIDKLVLAQFNPLVTFNDSGNWMVVMERSVAPTVEDLAAPELRIAGLRINPDNFSPSRQSYYTKINFRNVVTGNEVLIKNLPVNLKATSVSWNRAGNKIAFVHENKNTIELYLVDLKTAIAKKINKTPLNIISGSAYDWADDNTVLYQGTTAAAALMPKKSAAPDGPVVQQNLGKVAASRTYQDLIKNKYDEQLYRFFAKSQIISNTNGIEKKIGPAGYYNYFDLSPNKKYLLVSRLTNELSYLVPAYGFASTFEVWNANGTPLKTIASRPSSELAPSGFDNVLNAPRGIGWVETKPNTLRWIVPLDSGLIKKDIPYHDALVTIDAPFNTQPATLLQTPLRLNNVNFVNDSMALVVQGSFAKQKMIWSLLNLKTNQLTTLSDRSTNDAYNDVGAPFTARNEYGKYVPVIYNKTKFIMRNQGASPKGDYPFIGTFEFKNLQQHKLWQSADPDYEVPVKLLNYKDDIRFVTSRQTNADAPNYFIVSINGKERKAITNFADPQPELRQLKKEKITYTRKDGIQLTANLYVAKDYNPLKDGKLPVIIVAYPREFKSANDAAQVRGSKNTFTQISYGSFIFFALKGYAVMDNTEFPIVGEGDKYPNDNFTDQLEWNAKAAIDKIAAMGIGDSTRVAVAGHSYGAFMTANLLAHTNLFKAGIARSGAYNRTLTPFGFQNEERTYWQAPEIYFKMGPFSYANKIKTPLLLIHGEADNNPGTFPIQSERLFNAIKGHGGTVRFVQLPFESHGYAAKENLLHLLWEEYQWLEKYVKGK